MANGRLMAPWEAKDYFEPLSHRTVAPGGGEVQQLAPADPNRVLLAFSLNAAQGSLWLLTTVRSLAQSNSALVIWRDRSPLVIQHEWWGGAVNEEWWGSSPVGGDSLGVFEVRLKSWPSGSGVRTPKWLKEYIYGVK